MGQREARIQQGWIKAGIEPFLDDVLADPIVLLMMRCDNLRPSEVRRVAVAAGDWLRSRGAQRPVGQESSVACFA